MYCTENIEKTNMKNANKQNIKNVYTNHTKMRNDLA